MKLILFLIGFSLIGFAWKQLYRRETTAPAAVTVDRQMKRKVALETISQIWANRRDTVIAIEEIALIWRQNVEGKTEEPERPPVVLRDDDLRLFYEEYIKDRPHFRAPALDVVETVLVLLDREDCPSVVNTQGEEESKLTPNAYDLLSKVSLRRHTINVAEELLKLIPPASTSIPEAIIAALGHDLGKLPSFRGQLYSLGDHALISVAVLNQVAGFDVLPYKDRIIEAVRGHMKKPAERFLAKNLKLADQNARQRELAQNSESLQAGQLSVGALQAAQEQREQEAPGTNADREPSAFPVEAPQSSPAGPAEAYSPPGGYVMPFSNPETTSGYQPNEVFGSPAAEEEKVKVELQELPLQWFDPDEFLRELVPFVNKLFGSRWKAFSMKDGHVYVYPELIWELLKKIGNRRGEMSVFLGDQDKELKQNYIYSAVKALRRENDAIAGLIKDRYYGGYFILKMADGSERNAYYTPFNVEAFGATASELEGQKQGKLKEIIEVYPKYE